jgi:hypothetical protein
MARTKTPAAKASHSAQQVKVRLYTVKVFLLSGPITEKFAKKNPVVSRTIQLRGDQPLADLHHTIFDAFGRWEDHLYEFQFGKGPRDPKAPGTWYPAPTRSRAARPTRWPAGWIRQPSTRWASKWSAASATGSFFGDDLWHQINVEAVEDQAPKGKLPKVTKKVGKSPSQYPDEDE